MDLRNEWRERVAETFADHEYDAVLSRGAYVPGCKCGWVADDEWASVGVYDQHVADALLAPGGVMEKIAGDAEKDAATHREVAESMTGLWQVERERADRLEAMCDRLAEQLVELNPSPTPWTEPSLRIRTGGASEVKVRQVRHDLDRDAG